MKFFVLHPFLSTRGGAEAVAARIVGHLAEGGHDVRLFTADAPHQARSALEFLAPSFALNRVVIEQPASASALPSFCSRPALLGYALLLRAAKRHPARLEADVVLSTYGESNIAGRVGLGCYVHYPVFASGAHAADRLGGRLTGLNRTRAVYRAICRRIAGYQEWHPGSLCMTNSGWTASEIARLIPAADAKVVYCPVEPLPKGPAVGATPRTADLQLICLGRLVGYKGHTRIVNALALAAGRTGRKFGVTFAGRGTPRDAEKLRALARPLVNVDVALNPTRDEIAALIANCHLGVSAFWHEHFGIAVAELMGSGLPVLVPDGGGQVEVVSDKRCIYRSEEELAQRLAAFALDADELQAVRPVAAAGERFSRRAFTARVDAALAGAFPNYLAADGAVAVVVE